MAAAFDNTEFHLAAKGLDVCKIIKGIPVLAKKHSQIFMMSLPSFCEFTDWARFCSLDDSPMTDRIWRHFIFRCGILSISDRETDVK
jgi:hypothetical protein